MKKPVISALCLLLAFFSGCGREEKERPEILLNEGMSLPAVTRLTWLDTGREFTSHTADGLVRTWDVFSGLVSVTESTLPEIFTESAVPVSSADETMKIAPSADGAVSLFDADGKELAKYYGFGSGEWVSVVSEGYYAGSFGGGNFLSAKSGERRYSLERLSGALFRPDLFRATLQSKINSPDLKPEPGEILENLFDEVSAPPELSVFFDEAANKLNVKITAQKGGAGLVALYRRAGGSAESEIIPAGFIDVEKTAEKKYAENGGIVYEINAAPAPEEGGTSFAGVSAFNRNNTVESERLWVKLPAAAERDSSRTLRALIAAPDPAREHTAALCEFFSRQEEGGLYSGVELKELFGEAFTAERFAQTLEQLRAGLRKDDTLVVYLRSGASAGAGGNLRFLPDNSPGSEIRGEDLLELVSGQTDSVLLLLDLTESKQEASSGEAVETALLRFRKMLGPKAMLAAFGIKDTGFTFAKAVTDAFARNPEDGVTGAENRFVNASEILERAFRHAAEEGAETLLSFAPRSDFRIAGRLFNSGELKFQTMTSGMLKIDRVDKQPAALAFGGTMTRVLPAGNYIIDMVYRNGYRETRTVELHGKDSAWVIFTYTPPLLTGDFSGRLPSLGINLKELNPANYEKVNQEAMVGMGMAPFYVAFLAGEKLYKEGDYDSAVSEYSKAISLKGDYVDAWVSRGNAQRRKGDLNKAVEDYSRALRLKNGYAEVYNYRGYVYAQKNNLNLAIADYTQAIRFRPDYADAYFNRAYAFAAQKNWDRAVTDYTRVIQLEPAGAAAYSERAKAWQGKGDTAKAAEDYAAAEKLK